MVSDKLGTQGKTKGFSPVGAKQFIQTTEEKYDNSPYRLGSDTDESASSNGGTPAAELVSDYRKLKAELFELITINEMLNDEVKWGKQRLLTLNMDNYFLMERLLSHEKPPARKYNKRKKKGEEEGDSRGQTDHEPQLGKHSSGS